ncbi:hypothetical protein EV685_2773 [Sphaerotilus mobilis]|uniref:Uncharacterized protein n=2 Tax=Sphaerotilus mobilis TaxID=47994 RepID=A0A4Q7LI64_9BURK|nr:hypothetical protein EV685_2773 [Sphaerotilus mobilis]
MSANDWLISLQLGVVARAIGQLVRAVVGLGKKAWSVEALKMARRKDGNRTKKYSIPRYLQVSKFGSLRIEARMNTKSNIGLFLAALLTSGCATPANWPWKAGGTVSAPKICANNACTEGEAASAFLQASIFCRDVHNYYENKDGDASNVRMGVTALGVFAGAVFAPITSGATATAWSSLSGATNGINSAIDSSFSQAIQANRRMQVVSAASEGQNQYAQAGDANKKVVTAVNMALNCSLAPAKADALSFNAISRSQQGPQTSPTQPVAVGVNLEPPSPAASK